MVCFLFWKILNFPKMILFSKTSGRNFSRVPMRMTVTMPSATPITEWLMAMAGTAKLKPYWKTGVDKPSSVPADMAAKTSPTKADMKIVVYKEAPIFSLKALLAARKIRQGMNTPIMPMFKTLAPRVVSPPSPNRSACKTNIIVTEMHPAKGPSIRPIDAPPKRWAVVPPMIG